MAGKKSEMPVFDMKMSSHWALGRAVDALFGIRIKDKLAWPPAQIDGDNTVERCPELNYISINGTKDLNQIIGGWVDYPVIDPKHAQILTAQRDIYISEPELFGGDTEGNGGVGGLFSWLPGKVNQFLPSFITSRYEIPADQCPSYRGIATGFFSGARNPRLGVDRNGIVKGGLVNQSNIAASNNQGFWWTTNDKSVPAPSFRAFRMCRVEHFRQWASWWINPYNAASGNYPGTQYMTQVIETPRSEPRDKPEGDGKLQAGGGYPSLNPAAVIWELMSSSTYDEAASEDRMDKDSFLLCARRLAFEKMGISFQWVDQESVKQIVQDICSHIGAAVFNDPITNKYTMRLLRPDAAFTELRGRSEDGIPLPWNTGFIVNPDTAQLDGDFEQKLWSDVINHMDVKYTDDETGETKTVSVQNANGIAAAGGRINDQELNFWMLRSEASAIAAGERELSNVCRPMMKAAFTLNRRAWGLMIFDVVNVTWPSEGVVNTRFRIVNIDYGDGEDRKVRIEVIEDVFNETPRKSGHVPQPPLWTPAGRPTMRDPWFTPASAPMLIANGVPLDDVLEMDAEDDAAMIHLVSSDRPLTSADAFVKFGSAAYPKDPTPVHATPRALLGVRLETEAVSTLGFYDLDFGAQEEDPEVGDLLVVVRPRPDKTSLNRFWTTIGGGRQNGMVQTSYGTPEAPSKLHWGIGTAAMALDPDSDRNASLLGLAPAYHEEVCLITAVNQETGVVSIRRGCYDTVPAPIPSEAWVYHLKNSPPVPVPTINDGTMGYAVYRPKSASAVARETTEQKLFIATARQDMPARPGNVRMTIDSKAYAFGSKATLDEPMPIAVAWNSRNRLLDDANPAAWTGGNVTPESDQRHYVRVWRRVRRAGSGDAPAILVAQFYDLTGSSYVIPANVIANAMTDAQWNTGAATSDIEYGAAFAIEVGAQRMLSGTRLGSPEFPGDGPAQMSAQAALLLMDVGTSPGGYGLNYGRDYGGT